MADWGQISEPTWGNTTDVVWSRWGLELRDSAFSADTIDAWLVLVTISHDDLSAPVRVVNNTVDLVSRGETFVGYPFEVVLPDQREDAPPRARIQIDNVDRQIAEAVRSVTSAPLVTMEVVRGSAPNLVELSYPFFYLHNVKWDAGKVSGDLTVEDFTTEPYPSLVFSPAAFPSLM